MHDVKQPQPSPRLGWKLFIGFAFGLSNIVRQIGSLATLHDLTSTAGYPTDGEPSEPRRRAFRVLFVANLLWIISSRDHFAIEMPSGMAEDRHDYGEAQEER
jgi:hypothetical protein